MKSKKILAILICVSVCLSVFVFSGCGAQDSAINELDNYVKELEKTEEYDLCLVKAEIYKGKEKIKKEEKSERIAEIKNITLKKAERYVLPSDVLTEVKTKYCESHEHVAAPEEVKILIYLGKYDDNYALIVAGDTPLTLEIQSVDGLSFGNWYVSVYNNGELKWLGNAYKEGIVDHTDLEDIHKAYIRYDFYVW